MKLLAFSLIALPLLAHDPVTTRLTYTRDISRLINRHCLTCHGASSTVPLATYEQARPWAKAIRDQVMTRQMPPWGAVPGFGPDLEGDPSLTTSEIDIVIRWVEGGAPEGDATLLPRTTPPAPKPLPGLHSPLTQIGCEWRSPRDTTLLGLRAGKPLRLTLNRPDGAVLPVIWLRNLTKQPNDFLFIKPLAIPRNSVLRIESEAAADAALALSPAIASLPPPGRATRKQTPRCPGS